MPEELVRVFSTVSKEDVSIAGGKGASLGEMIQNEIPIPNGFVVLSNAFEQFISETGLNVEIDSILHQVNHKEMHTVENASEEIQALILEQKFPKYLSKIILKEFEKLQTQFVAVRSSATAEDSSSAAWAGQLDTFLNTNKENLLENVKKCWASLFTPRAIFYRFEKELHKTKISVAVVIQKMVESEVSGIAFSVHPVTEDYNQLIIEAGYGLGESIVSGQITPDSYVVEKKPFHILNKQINTQTKKLIRKESQQGGNEWKTIEKEKGEKQKLSDKQVLELSKLILQIEKHYQFPVDIEWAMEKGKFYITQSRPITTLGGKGNMKQKPTYNENQTHTSSDYVRMFEFTGQAFITNSIALVHYIPLEIVAIFRDNLWTTFLPKSVENKTLKEGKALLSSAEKFFQFAAEFEKYRIESAAYFEDTLSKPSLTSEELNQYFVYAGNLWKYYKKTEFFYVDEAYKTALSDPLTAKNLEKLGHLKNEGREYLNKLLFGSASYISKVLSVVSKQFNVSVEDLFWYSTKEILSLFKNKHVPKEELDRRRNSYVFRIEDGKMVTLSGKEAKNFIKEFHSILEHTTILKGITANKGKINGTARVLLYGADTFDHVSKMVEKMKKGEILVAETTSPEIIVACQKAGAILTNQGGLMSHAAIVSREIGIPCVVGLENATHYIQTGDWLEVDADAGIVKILRKKK